MCTNRAPSPLGTSGTCTRRRDTDRTSATPGSERRRLRSKPPMWPVVPVMPMTAPLSIYAIWWGRAALLEAAVELQLEQPDQPLAPAVYDPLLGDLLESF